MVEQERLANFYCWREIGRRMNIRDIPESYSALDHFKRSYESQHVSPSDADQRVGIAGRDMFFAWCPPIGRGLASQAIYSLLDRELLMAFGFPAPPPAAQRLWSAACPDGRASSGGSHPDTEPA